MRVVPKARLTILGKIDKWLWFKRVRIVMMFARLMNMPVDVYSMQRT